MALPIPMTQSFLYVGNEYKEPTAHDRDDPYLWNRWFNFNPVRDWLRVRNKMTSKLARVRKHPRLLHEPNRSQRPPHLMVVNGAGTPYYGMPDLPKPDVWWAASQRGLPPTGVLDVSRVGHYPTAPTGSDEVAQARIPEVAYSDLVFRKTIAKGGFGIVALYDIKQDDGTLMPVIVKLPFERSGGSSAAQTLHWEKRWMNVSSPSFPLEIHSHPLEK